LLPVIMFTYWVSYQYLRVSRDTKRLESINKSPVFIHFSESIQGLSVIRAFNQESKFLSTCFRRIDVMNRCHLYLWLCNRWLNFRMQLMGGFVAAVTGCAIVYQVQHSHVGSTAAGLALVYSLNFTEYLTFLARTHADVS
jgi:ABC-type transport system involved in cytochrome bd biosynthesis fused ATPase/permease subunit